jgi:hypothetical protein
MIGAGSELRHPLGVQIVDGLSGQPGAPAVHDAGDSFVVGPAESLPRMSEEMGDLGARRPA